MFPIRAGMGPRARSGSGGGSSSQVAGRVATRGIELSVVRDEATVTPSETLPAGPRRPSPPLPRARDPQLLAHRLPHVRPYRGPVSLPAANPLRQLHVPRPHRVD